MLAWQLIGECPSDSTRKLDLNPDGTRSVSGPFTASATSSEPSQFAPSDADGPVLRVQPQLAACPGKADRTILRGNIGLARAAAPHPHPRQPCKRSPSTHLYPSLALALRRFPLRGPAAQEPPP